MVIPTLNVTVFLSDLHENNARLRVLVSQSETSVSAYMVLGFLLSEDCCLTRKPQRPVPCCPL